MILRLGIIDRYLLREATAGWLLVTLVLMLLILGRAAAGKLPQELVLKLVGLSSIEYLVVILPISLLLGVMLALGRLYRDNEMSAITAAGLGLQRLYRPFAPLLITVAIITAWLSIDLSPWASGKVNQLRQGGRQEAVDLQAFAEGQFRSIMDGRGVFYTEGMDRKRGLFTNVFVRVKTAEGTTLIMAKAGRQEIDPKTRARILVLLDGYRYEGEPGEADYLITAFQEHGVRISPPQIQTKLKSSAKPLDELLASSELKDWVELNWRLSIPLTVLILGLMAVPLAHSLPRQGRYGRLIIALVIYLIYSNLLTVGRVSAEEGKVTVGLGIWAVHGVMFSYVFWLIARREGWWRRPFTVPETTAAQEGEA
jgi:lipopolysaccharide export system permease protein